MIQLKHGFFLTQINLLALEVRNVNIITRNQPLKIGIKDPEFLEIMNNSLK